MKAWLAHHLHSFLLALEQFRTAPIASLFTILVIGVAASLPAGLYVLLSNLERAAGGVEPHAEVTVFFKPDVDDAKARQLAKTLGKRKDVTNADFVSKSEGVRRLEAVGLAEITAGLPENPLPHTVVLTPRDTRPAALESLADEIKAMPEVEQVMADTDWIKRLAALMTLGHDLVGMLVVVLAAALAAITGNTIRLQIYAQKEEIEVARLIGATDRFIRRPFLYFGSIQGLTGGVAGLFCTLLAGWQLQTSVSGVAAAYGSQFLLVSMSVSDTLLFLCGSTVLGWLGAFFAVSHALNQSEASR